MADARISAAESQVMGVAWAADGAGVEEILAAVGPVNGWSESTVRTLIHRLIRKGALASERRRGRTVYAPRLSREAWLTSEGQGMLDRLFDGRLTGLVAHLTRERAVAPEDLARLKRLVAELDAEDED
ncbi:BlaI/MecI/CopY family transcriptional regulator [Phenylobacterium sp.]|jgi:BlaI family penicillinase repressor|uniref:BlaI/MecI/CopY family transcriptional regulator n=1 Tax=Phenylobacterium sp. TaxID=1871053 RepID=UPI0037CA2FE9